MIAFVHTHTQTLVKLTLAAACLAMIILWPQWRAALGNEGYYRMTGGGTGGDSAGCTVGGVHVKHGFELHCDANQTPNNLEVNWTIDGETGSHRFHLEALDIVSCTDNPLLDENPPVAGFDTYEGSGTGLYNGVSGATAVWVFTDDGEPGRNDLFDIVITDASGNNVLDVSCFLDGGNHQAHKK